MISLLFLKLWVNPAGQRCQKPFSKATGKNTHVALLLLFGCRFKAWVGSSLGSMNGALSMYNDAPIGKNVAWVRFVNLFGGNKMIHDPNALTVNYCPSPKLRNYMNLSKNYQTHTQMYDTLTYMCTLQPILQRRECRKGGPFDKRHDAKNSKIKIIQKNPNWAKKLGTILFFENSETKTTNAACKPRTKTTNTHPNPIKWWFKPWFEPWGKPRWFFVSFLYTGDPIRQGGCCRIISKHSVPLMRVLGASIFFVFCACVTFLNPFLFRMSVFSFFFFVIFFLLVTVILFIITYSLFKEKGTTLRVSLILEEGFYHLYWVKLETDGETR